MSSAFTMRRPLGKTGLQVSPLGIGGGGGISSEDLLYAFDKGINYFLFSSDMHHFVYQRSAQALRALCGHGSATREQVVLATVSYVNHPEKLPGILADQFTELGVDYIDVFHWGWITDEQNMVSLIKKARQLQRVGDVSGTVAVVQGEMRRQAEQADAINKEILKRGLVRHIGASFHSRAASRLWMKNMDVMMLRYNISHLGVEKDVVPFLTGDKTQDPGMVMFNTTHLGLNRFHTPPPGYPAGQYVPSSPDCYRFALSQPWVDLVLMGISNREQVDQALAALEQGPVSAEERAAMVNYGEIFRKSWDNVALAGAAH
jgi:aryl-alcohol dehydrogenase-like predicted oxidoreductase